MTEFNSTIKLKLWMKYTLKKYSDPLWLQWYTPECWPNAGYMELESGTLVLT